MCGIAGFWQKGALGPDSARKLRAMTDAIRHRGPDDSGDWFDEEAGLALGHRRLSIIDLSAAGHQPMASSSGRYVLVYNGEIYNHRSLRAELERLGVALNWRGHSDTEVILGALDHWGVIDTLERLNGMFGFALWDRRRRVLTLARDRLGEKPVYYSDTGNAVLFASELKALVAHPGFAGEVDRAVLTSYLRFNYVPAPYSIWRGVYKLPPASFIEISNGGRTVGEPTSYWSLRAVVEAGAADPLPEGPETIEEVEALLKDAVKLRMEADVPLGAFLSGGIDSSTIVALMQAQSTKPVKTFTIGFGDRQFNEAEHAKAVATHLGTDHTELYVGSADALAVVPRLAQIWDEPFADSSQIPTLLVSELTRRHVTVSLSGDGGDELFGGYNRYISGMRLWNAGVRLPTAVRRMAAQTLQHRATGSAVAAMMQFVPARHRQLGLADRLPKAGQLLAQPTAETAYLRLISRNNDPATMVVGGDETLGPFGDAPAFSDFRQKMMYLDTLNYLPDDILTKVDRATMAVSLEGRIPFLDHRVVELAWRLPMSAKIRDGRGKRVLRDVLYRYVPESLVERPKMGFAVPVAQWLRGPLRGWAEDLIDEHRLKSEGLLEAAKVRGLWRKLLAGHNAVAAELWALLMFQAWHETCGSGVAVGRAQPATA